MAFLLFLFRINFIVWRTRNLRASIASAHICTNFIIISAKRLCFALIDVWNGVNWFTCLNSSVVKLYTRTLTCSPVHTQFISGRTRASIRSRCIVTNAHAQIILFVHLTLINVFACSIILRQPVARIACTSIRSPEIDATLGAQALYFFALIDVNANFVVFVAFLETVQTVTPIRANCVQAFSVYRTNLRKKWEGRDNF